MHVIRHIWHRLWRSPRSSTLRYLVVRPPVGGEIGKVGELLSFLAADRGWEVLDMVAHHDGTTEYLMARRD